METLQRLAVLFSGAFIVLLVTWMLTTAGESGNTMLSPRHSSVPQGKEPIVPGEELPATKSPSALRQPRQLIEKDTINWRKQAIAPTPAAEAPSISGKIPPIGNPNQVFVNAAQRILPAVVSIENVRSTRSSTFDLFHPFLKEENKKEGEEELLPPGSGSGIIISDNGFILTNNHVIEEARELRVKLFDKREFAAQLVGSDPTTDLAVIRIQAVELPAAFIGNSDEVMIGEWVMAVGNPLNFTSTVTTGIVSALGRNINIIDGNRYRYKIENFIQTDAVINPGNSGGALVNLEGAVVGINTAIATRSGYYQGYGFSIPINLAKKVSDDLISFGRVRRAILGVSIDQVDDRTARAVGLDRPTGALIQSVSRNSPAESAGLRQGDIVLAVAGEEVVSINDLQIKIAQHRPGDSVTLRIWRDRSAWEVDVELGEAPGDNQPLTQQSVEERKTPGFDNYGITLRLLSAEEKQQFSLAEGLVVESVKPNSPAARAGVYSMDVIIKVDDAPISSLAAFEKIVAAAESGDYVKLTLKYRNNTDTRIVFIEVP